LNMITHDSSLNNPNIILCPILDSLMDAKMEGGLNVVPIHIGYNLFT
jgi:hypothetical protein